MDIRDARVANIYAGRDLRGLLGKLTLVHSPLRTAILTIITPWSDEQKVAQQVSSNVSRAKREENLGKSAGRLKSRRGRKERGVRELALN